MNGFLDTLKALWQEEFTPYREREATAEANSARSKAFVARAMADARRTIMLVEAQALNERLVDEDGDPIPHYSFCPTAAFVTPVSVSSETRRNVVDHRVPSRNGQLKEERKLDELSAAYSNNQSLRPLRKPKPGEWYQQFANKRSKEPNWTKTTNPVANDVHPDDAAWWLRDHQLKRQMISAYVEEQIVDEDADSASVSSCAIESESSAGAFPRLSHNLNARTQYAGMASSFAPFSPQEVLWIDQLTDATQEIALSKLIVNLDGVRTQAQREIVAAHAAVREGRMQVSELLDLQKMWDQQIKDADDELNAALEC